MKKPTTLEGALTRLEEITQQLQTGEEPLETALKLYEEGCALISYCNETLKKAEEKILNVSVVNLKEEEPVLDE